MGRTRKVTTIVGEQNAGKSTFALAMVQGYKHGMTTIFDHQREKVFKRYPEFPDKRYFAKQKTGIYRWCWSDWKEFTDNALEVYERRENMDDNRKGHIIYEDLSGAIKDKNEYPPLMNLMISCRKKSVDITMMFHHLWRIPPYIMDSTHELVVFKTGEHPDKGDHKRFKHGDRVLEAFDQVRNDPNPHAFRIAKLQGFESKIY